MGQLVNLILILFLFLLTADARERSPRVRALLANMTLAEKARQLDMYSGGDITDGHGHVNWTAIDVLFSELGVGVIHDFYPPTAAISNQIQNYLITKTPNKIPALFVEECLHGYMQSGHTIFPAPISIGASFDFDMVHRIGQSIASEARAFGVGMCLSPVCGAAREPRWGRVVETFGEDTWALKNYVRAYVTGMQGNSNGTALNRNTSVISEPKHYGGHSMPEGGQNACPVHVGQRELLDTFLPVFQAAVQDAGARGIMAAYHETDGIPSCASEFLLTEQLRDTWGFKGFVLSDLGAINMVWSTHAVATTPEDAIRQYLEAGGNMQFYDFDHDTFQNSIIGMVQNGTLNESVVDDRVADILNVKEDLGLFDNPLTDEKLYAASVNSQTHQQLALEAAQKSLVLLKNNQNSAGNPILPLDYTKLNRIALIGPSIDDAKMGDYTAGAPGFDNVNNRNIINILQGVTNVLKTLNPQNKVQIFNSWGTGNTNDAQFYPIHRNHFTDTQGNEGLTGYYYNSTDLSGTPVLIRNDPEINNAYYLWGPLNEGSAGTVIDSADFSINWIGTLTPTVDCPDAQLNILVGSDAGARLYIDGNLILDIWNATTAAPVNFSFSASQSYKITVQYHQNSSAGHPECILVWNLVGQDGTGISRAASVAAKADVAIVAVGDDDNTVGEGRDRSELGLFGRQLELVQAVVNTGVTTIVVLLHGRPVSEPYLLNGPTAAVLSAWFPGQSQGTAIAQALFGVINPSGKMPMSTAPSSGVLPIFYNYKPSARLGYGVEGGWAAAQPLWPFAFGLSYTTFSLANMVISPKNMTNNSGGKITVQCLVTNTGKVPGTEIVQLYIRDQYSSTTRPVIELRGAQRVTLTPGQFQTVTFTLDSFEDLKLLDRNMNWVTEAGTFTFSLGTTSSSFSLVDFFDLL